MKLTRTRALRWAVPGAAVAAVAVAASGVLTADATPPLPPKTAAELLVAMQSVNTEGLSGTVVQKSDLGLPSLPAGVGPSGSSGTSLTSLLAGSHTLRVWSSAPDKQRIAVLGTLGESDLVRNGQDVWSWSSETKKSTHYKLPAGTTDEDVPTTPDGTVLTPSQAAAEALKALDPTTSVSTAGTGTVAGRPVYELVLAPKDTRSTLGQIRFALDSKTGLPLRVQVFGKASNAGPAFEVGFTRVSLTRPPDSQFTFNPPPGTETKEGGTLPGSSSHLPSGTGKAAGAESMKVVGTGWTSVVVLTGVDAAATKQAGPVLDRLPKVSGTWGSGRILTSKVVSVLITDDGRVLLGAVQPELLYAAAG